MKKAKKNKLDRKDRAEELANLDIFDLDENELDKHWLQQPKLVFKYAMQLAYMKDESRRLKTEVELARAEAGKHIREDPTSFGLPEKPTVSAIAEEIATDADVKDAQKKENRNLHEIDLVQAVLNALEHRKRALEGLVSLHGQNYFAIPRTDEEGKKHLDNTIQRRVRGGKKI